MNRIKHYLSMHLYGIKTAFQQLSHGVSSVLMTMLVLAIAIAIPAAMWVGLSNFSALSAAVDKSVEINAFLNERVSTAQAHSLLNELKERHDIASIRYISPKEGLAAFEKEMGFRHLAHSLGNNPIPGAYVITPIFTLSPNDIQSLVKFIQKFPEVDAIQTDLTWIQRLHAILNFGDRLVYSLAMLFGISVLLIIGNTIRLITQNHHDEIVIVKQIGATNGFVRRPFLYMGLIYGYCSGILAWLLVEAVFSWLQQPIVTLTNLYQSHFHLHSLAGNQVLGLLLVSSMLGLLGSYFSVNHYLRTSY